TVTVNPNITPVFSFGTSLMVCAGRNVPTLVNGSTNGITGTWSPSVIDNQNSGTYTFTPTAGQCAVPVTLTVTVNPNVPPTFSFGSSLTICAGGTVPVLPGTSTNGLVGTWVPSVVDNQNSGTYTFTPDGWQCSMPVTFTVTVNPNIPPTFSFGTSLTICAGGTVPALSNTSTNGITGAWSPSVVDDQNSGSYIFTPTAGLCATTTTFTVTVNPNITPAFSFGTSLTICAGGSVPTLPNTSTNGITGTWSPSVVDNQNSGTYTFTPNPGQCVTGPVTFTVTVTSNIIPVFSFGTTLSICAGDAVPVLPGISDNGITGTWNPAVVSNQSSGTYIFTAAPGQCVTPFTFTVTVNPIVTPAFSFGTFQSVCIGTTVPTLPNTSTNGISGTWSPSVVDNMTNGTYTFTPSAGQCAVNTTFTLEVNAMPSTTVRTDTTVYDGAVVPAFNFIANPAGTISWTSSNTSIGVAESGTGTVPSFTAINMTNDPVTSIITATPSINGCSGLAQSYRITVLPLNKDVFVPNVFSPNADGKNDLLYVYGNYITKVDMRIFNQWGQQIATISSKAQGWDGTHKGSAQPVGVYVYILRAELSNGKTVNLKGSITLVR
ncbi:MAG TPA: gliding motility-associated C-terminal domain-containing protein, partial [Chitinophagaceae bacterium]